MGPPKEEMIMEVPQNCIIAVVDGENFNLYRNTGQASDIKLTEHSAPDTEDRNSDSGRSSSAGNPDAKQMAEDAFGKGVTERLNKMVLDGNVQKLIIIAAPRSLGEMRRSYHAKLQDVLVGEIDKTLTGASIAEIQSALENA
jgi:protein required for attachment to host cells